MSAPRFSCMDHPIDHFITRLSQTRLDGPAVNPYAAVATDPVLEAANRIRRHNLRLYLHTMAAARPWLLLVGEAPGYRGCRLTGGPFTSEAILVSQGIWLFSAQAGFRKSAERDIVIKEATATIIWSALAGWQPPPLLWNAFPFHAHRDGQPASNRKPNAPELRLGAAFLIDLVKLFQPQVVAAVGRSAAHALDHAGLSDYHQLRHPSHGGKAAFMTGLSQIQTLAKGR